MLTDGWAAVKNFRQKKRTSAYQDHGAPTAGGILSPYDSFGTRAGHPGRMSQPEGFVYASMPDERVDVSQFLRAIAIYALDVARLTA